MLRGLRHFWGLPRRSLGVSWAISGINSGIAGMPRRSLGEGWALFLDLLRSVITLLTLPERSNCDEGKLQEKLTAKAQEVTRIEETLGDLEDQFRLMSSAHAEVQKFREASDQIKYQLEKLTSPRKKILCHLLIYRIEMTRSRAPNATKWDVSAEIFFRFNPNRIPSEITKGRTSIAHNKAILGDLKPKNDVGGEVGSNRYTLFRFAIRWESDRSRVWVREK